MSSVTGSDSLFIYSNNNLTKLDSSFEEIQEVQETRNLERLAFLPVLDFRDGDILIEYHSAFHF